MLLVGFNGDVRDFVEMSAREISEVRRQGAGEMDLSGGRLWRLTIWLHVVIDLRTMDVDTESFGRGYILIVVVNRLLCTDTVK